MNEAALRDDAPPAGPRFLRGTAARFSLIQAHHGASLAGGGRALAAEHGCSRRGPRAVAALTGTPSADLAGSNGNIQGLKSIVVTLECLGGLADRLLLKPSGKG